MVDWNTVNGATWNLICVVVGVVIGAIIGFVFDLARDHIHENQQKQRYFKNLLVDLGYNKKLAEENKILDYRTLVFNKYLHDLPEELRTKIYDAQSIISRIYLPWSGDSQSYVRLISPYLKKLKELLESIIPQLEEYSENKK